MENTKKPDIRFKGFTEAWEQRKLEDIADIVGGGTPSTSNPEYWDGDIDWYAPAEMEGQRYAVGSVKKITELGFQKSSAQMLPAGRTVLFTSRAGIGKMAILQHPAATNQGFQSIVLKDGNNPYFIYSMGSEIKKKAESIASGSTFLEISGKMLGSLVISIPSEAEQDEIATYFRNLDNLITLHQRKCDRLLNVKKSMLEKMFPKNGSIVPEIRFKGFTEAWEQRKVEELASDTYGGGTPSTSNDEFWNGTIPWIQSSDLTEHQVFGVTPRKYISQTAVMSSATKIVPENSLAIITRVGVGKLAVMPFSYATSQDFLSLSKLKTDVVFTAYLLYKKLQSELNSVQGTSIKGITKDELLAKVVAVPECKEQEAIGNYFLNLDNLITLHQRMCNFSLLEHCAYCKTNFMLV